MSYRVTTKKNLIIFHKPAEWEQVLDRLEQEFGTHIRMRHVMRRELGFVTRNHQGLEPNCATGQLYTTQEFRQG